MAKIPRLYYFSRLTPERVDKDSGIIRGVSVITGGVQAKGHPLLVDSETVREFYAACEAKGQVKTKANHKSGVKEVNGFLADFRVVPCSTGEKLLADWHLLKKDPNYEHTLEIAERMPNTVGLSGSFTSPKAFEKGQKTPAGMAARVKEVLSVDFVTDPAANPDGLFEVGDEENAPSVDTPQNDMEKTPTEIMLEKILKNQTDLAAEVQGIKEFQDNLQAEREQYEQEQAELEGQEEGEQEGQEQEEAEGEGRGQEDPVAEAFAAVMTRITQLEAGNAEAADQAEQDRMATLFDGIEEQITLLTAQRDEALAELEQYKNPRVAASADGVRLFSANIPGQSDFEAYVSQSVAEGKKRTVAISEFIATYPDKYQEHLESKRPVSTINLSR